jgi:hypothetical protein
MYCAVVENHHQEEWDTVNKMLAIVRFVNLACHRVGLGLKHEPDLALINTREAEILDIGELQIAELLDLLDETRDVEF